MVKENTNHGVIYWVYPLAAPAPAPPTAEDPLDPARFVMPNYTTVAEAVEYWYVGTANSGPSVAAMEEDSRVQWGEGIYQSACHWRVGAYKTTRHRKFQRLKNLIDEVERRACALSGATALERAREAARVMDGERHAANVSFFTYQENLQKSARLVARRAGL